MKISELPEPYKSLAEKRRAQHEVYPNEDKIDSAFCWDDTPEGYNFWDDVHNAVELPPIPGTVDPTNPAHYMAHPSGVECIQITEHFGFNLGNVIKYVWRAGRKGGIEDLKKARWYIEREITRLEGGTERTLHEPVPSDQRPEVLAHDRAERGEAVRNDAEGSGGGGRIDEHELFMQKWGGRLKATESSEWLNLITELDTDVLKLTQENDINRNGTEHGKYTTTGTNDFKISGSELP